MKVTKIVQKHFLCTSWGFLVTIICDVKIDVNMCEPHNVNLFFFQNNYQTAKYQKYMFILETFQVL